MVCGRGLRLISADQSGHLRGMPDAITVSGPLVREREPGRAPTGPTLSTVSPAWTERLITILVCRNWPVSKASGTRNFNRTFDYAVLDDRFLTNRDLVAWYRRGDGPRPGFSGQAGG